MSDNVDIVKLEVILNLGKKTSPPSVECKMTGNTID